MILTNKVGARLFLFSNYTSSYNPYKVLGVDSSASPSQIKAKYYELAQQYHPDKNLTSSYDKFNQIREAYHLLKDIDKRSQIDKNLASGGPALWNRSRYSGMHHYGSTRMKRSQYQKYEESMKFKDDKKYQQWANKANWDDIGAQFNKRNGPTANENQYFFKFVLYGCLGISSFFIMVQIIIKIYNFNKGPTNYTELS